MLLYEYLGFFRLDVVLIGGWNGHGDGDSSSSSSSSGGQSRYVAMCSGVSVACHINDILIWLYIYIIIYIIYNHIRIIK